MRVYLNLRLRLFVVGAAVALALIVVAGHPRAGVDQTGTARLELYRCVSSSQGGIVVVVPTGETADCPSGLLIGMPGAGYAYSIPGSVDYHVSYIDNVFDNGIIFEGLPGEVAVTVSRNISNLAIVPLQLIAGQTTVQQVVLYVPPNSPPIIAGGVTTLDYTVDETRAGQTPVAIPLPLALVDLNGDPLTLELSAPLAQRARSTFPRLTFAGTGGSYSTSYLPVNGFVGTDQYGILVADGNGGTLSLLIDVTVVNTDDPPVAKDEILPDSFGDTARVIPFADLLANDRPGANDAAAGDTLIVSAVSDPVGGTVRIVGQTVEFTPTAGYSGPASFRYTVQDRVFGAAQATASFTVTVHDTTGPVITWVGGPQPNRSYTRSNLPGEPTCTATDAASTVTQCRVYGYSTEPGTHTLTARARDDAGNSSVSTRTYTVTASAPTATPRPTSVPPTATPARPARPTTAPVQPTATPVTPVMPTRPIRPRVTPAAPTATPSATRPPRQ